ncbi:bifunctional glutamate N-acetyltransferase/amino-acid acetyltransferase ArgJ [bacterium]|nr:bifunctional glutamate N-acetyltransferase/amino-acid acetyltransferase ArgJ [bacterium]OIP38381.1 MAG: bifunctional ornithine acetyltransferase/N-acetylglutamate synthase [Desulfobacteraceae bacterium CG2_30_51_40]
MKNEIKLPQGFKASAIESGLKKHGGLDMALVYSDLPAAAAGVFTTNKVKAAPVLVTRENIKGGKARAIVANAGNANACTGQEGLRNARMTAELIAGALGIGKGEIMVASTGVIGQQMNMDIVSKAVPELIKNLSSKGLMDAARAVMTTDSFPKLSMRESVAGGKPFRITGFAKGAGMIMPDMATMLCFIVSDINPEGMELNRILKENADKTFNRITVDGDTSTNDTVLLLVNGASSALPVSKEEAVVFSDLLAQVMDELCTMIVKDGEGASKLVRITINGARDPMDADRAVRTVGNSSLVKTAFYGQDPNWGRIMAALGRSGIHMTESKVDIWIDSVKIVEGGMGKGLEAERLAGERMHNREFTLTIDLNEGGFSERLLASDLTHEYVSINASYRT